MLEAGQTARRSMCEDEPRACGQMQTDSESEED